MAGADIDIDFSHQDHSLLDLTRLLSRLEHSLLATDVDPSLKRSSYQRTRVGANIEYAHNLILRLEHTTPTPQTPSQRSGIQADLLEERALLKKLQDRLYELNQLDDESLEVSPFDDLEEEEEDLLSTYAPAENRSNSNVDKEADGARQNSSGQGSSNVATESHLRSRRNIQHEHDGRGVTTGAAVGDSPQGLAPVKSTTPFTAKPSTSDGETLLAQHSSEQETIVSDLLNLATGLKTSTLSFSDTLASSNPLLDQTVSSLDRNVSGMEGAERRMGMLRKMTEGRGWWSRLSLYAWVAVLWIALILIMFVMPKLRF